MDDLITSCRTFEEAYLLYEKAKMRMLEDGFKLRKWKTFVDKLSQKIREK